VRGEHLDNQLEPPHDSSTQAISHLRESIARGKHWYIALLEAIGMWNITMECHDGRDYCYLVADEAFDWILLAERLCLEIDGAIPEEEKIALLFFAIPPLELSREEFKSLIGETKHRAHLNYLYGVVIEEVLNLAIEEEVRKEQQTFVSYSEEAIEQEAYRRIYGADIDSLRQSFWEERGYASGDTITLAEAREFTYWLFRYRLEYCDKTKVASDTKKALDYLQRQRMNKMFLERGAKNLPNISDIIDMEL